MAKKRSRSTIIDVARLAGVSISTVSRVLNKNVPVAEEASRRVWQAVEQLEYTPHAAAQMLARKNTRIIGLLLPGISGSFFSPMLRGIEACVREQGYNLLIYSTPNHAPAAETLKSSPLGEHNTDGLIVFADSLSNSEIAKLHKRKFPLVLLHRSPPPGLDVSAVSVENQLGTRKMMSHLIEVHGYRRIAFLKGIQEHEDAYWRELGYRKALEESNIPYDPQLVAEGNFDQHDAYVSVQQWLQNGIKMDAIFAADDTSAAGAVAALIQAGLRIPEDVAVVGFDDDPIDAFLPVKLTTVQSPIEQAGYEAVRQLVQLIQTGKAEPLVLLPTELVIRRSCGCGISE